MPIPDISVTFSGDYSHWDVPYYGITGGDTWSWKYGPDEYAILVEVGVKISGSSTHCGYKKLTPSQAYFFGSEEGAFVTEINNRLEPPGFPDSIGGTATIDFGESPGLPSKPINPTPSDEISDIKLSYSTLTWESGG